MQRLLRRLEPKEVWQVLILACSYQGKPDTLRPWSWLGLDLGGLDYKCGRNHGELLLVWSDTNNGRFGKLQSSNIIIQPSQMSNFRRPYTLLLTRLLLCFKLKCFEQNYMNMNSNIANIDRSCTLCLRGWMVCPPLTGLRHGDIQEDVQEADWEMAPKTIHQCENYKVITIQMVNENIYWPG